MINSCKQYYDRLHSAAGDVLANSFEFPHADAMAKSHAFIDDLAMWIGVLGTRPEVTAVQYASREYQFALLALSTGQYRAAFAALRLALELGFAAVQWSVNERELREWRRGERDSNWAALTDSENGILSKRFVLLFSEELAGEAASYRASAIAVYRECSEYVHGNAHTHSSLPGRLAFDSASFEEWQQKASVVRLTVTFALAARYLRDLDQAARRQLESVLLDQLGHSVGVRILLGVAIEETNG
jgi:hypothetical protein